MRKKIYRRLSGLAVNILFWCCMALVLYFMGQVFLFTSFRIPSDSMSPGLMAGDCAMVWKPTLGARVFNLFDALEGKKVKISRLPGMRKIRRNDVLVFHYPYPHSGDSIGMHLLKYYIKRCAALPGDTFYIDNGIYRVKGLADTLGLYYRQQDLSARADSTFQKEIFRCFPPDSAYAWTIKYFGPLYVPGKGDQIAIDTQNIVLYKNLIAYETGKTVIQRDGRVYLDEKPLESHVFTKDYYFMTGDYVFDSRDSRYWGLLPEDLIVGKAAFIRKSKDLRTGKWRWERFFKTIN